ncbi:MAG TPA: YdeI/OmpD-associated family protein [Propionicimonas sp.]|nr:YdeI/OmpD-associated family protein [Propionicimonas sp.]HQA77095.1 YdeI/OmpD-associated family protein [Propionicimonas sp.]
MGGDLASELTTALDANPAARATWDAFPPAAKKMALASIALAKQDATRTRRIAGIVAKAERGERPS